MNQPISSDAFRLATLRSERYRAVALLAIVAAFLLSDVVRLIVYAHDAAEFRRFAQYLIFWLFCGCYESVMLWLAIRAQRRPTKSHLWIPALNTLIECLFPSVAILGQTMDPTYLGPYLALASSGLILYCLFIILSTLRLSPRLCILAGSICSAGYTAVYLFTLWKAPHNHNREVFRPETFIISDILLFGAGLIAAAVARQIRQHVRTALAEAHTRARMQHDLEIARTIQMGLLPSKPPAIPGYDIAGWSQPADQTGGDFYDWLHLPADGGHDEILFTIADATGHGIGPALLAAACRAYFRALASHRDPLEQMTAQVDTLLAADVPPGRFITAAVALLDPQAHELHLYSAGHAPLYWFTAADRQILQFDSDQPPLGIDLPNPEPTRARILKLAPGDALILVTDGFFECANPAGELLGTDRLGQIVLRHSALPAQALIQTLHQEILAFSQNTPQLDDLTAVVIKRQASS